MPEILGFIITGTLVGPHGFQLVESVHAIEIFAEIGIILLLFVIGMEFSIKKMFEIRKIVFVGGSLQIVLTFTTTALITFAVLNSVEKAVFVGFLVTLSSTAIVMKSIQKRSEIDSPQGRISLGYLIFQDIMVVPMMLLIPVLGNKSGASEFSPVMLLIFGFLIIILVIVSAKWIVPKILFLVTKTRDKELFLITIIIICIGVALLTSSVGLSLALGAFLAGLIVSESEYVHQAISNVVPLRDIFANFFFVSIGMLFNVDLFIEHIGLIIGITFIVLLLKTIMTLSATAIIGYPIRIALIVGLYISQIGEFSFIMATFGLKVGLFNEEFFQYFLAISILSMILTPTLIGTASPLARFLLGLPVLRKLRRDYKITKQDSTAALQNHIVIIGFGINGRNISAVAKKIDIPYVVIEMNPETVVAEKKKGEKIFFGDGCQTEVLKHANIENARVVVVTIPDAASVRRITQMVHSIKESVYVIVRTRYVSEISILLKLGANEVIAEEYETSLVIFNKVMKVYDLSEDRINELLSTIRSDSYSILVRRGTESIIRK